MPGREGEEEENVESLKLFIVTVLVSGIANKEDVKVDVKGPISVVTKLRYVLIHVKLVDVA